MGCCIGRKKVAPRTTNQSASSNRIKALRLERDNDKNVKRREVRVSTFVEQKYNIFSSIGKGEFGYVLRAEHKQTKIPYAIKVIDLTRDINEKANPQSELKILSEVQHKYVIRLYDVMKTSRRLYLVMDLATGGELMDRICLLGSFDEYDATSVLTMILDGLRYLHSIGITHRDLKPQNILYYHPGNDSKIIITDFGLSAMRPANFLMKTDCGTIEYMAPEVITRALYTNAVDMWSMGVIAYIILSGRLPFPLNGNIMSTLRMICFCKYNFDGEPWSDISDEAKDFIGSLLVFDPTKRLTASGALQHKWMKNKEHSKRNLQRSISSNWSDSCVSLKNEKGLKRHARTKERESANSNSCKNATKGKSTYGTIYRSRDDKLHKGSHGKTRVSAGDRGPQRDVSTTTDSNSIYAEKYDNIATNCCGEMDKNLAPKRSDIVNKDIVKTQYADEKVKTKPMLNTDLNAKITTENEANEFLACQNNAVVQRKPSKQYGSKVTPQLVASEKNCEQKHAIDPSSMHESTVHSNAQDCNSNLEFVKCAPPSTRHVKSRVDDTISSRWNLADLEKDEDHVTERTPLSKVRTNNRDTLLPPIKSSVTPLNNTVKLKN